MSDICPHCGCAIYPGDEKTFYDYDWYHFECAEEKDIEEEEECES